MTNYAALRGHIVDALLKADGDLPVDQRQRLLDYARAAPGAQPPDPVLKPLIDKALTQAYKIVDADIARLRDAGLSEDAIYEAIVTTAAGAGLRRIDAGMEALQR
jgi:hypothetical protein